MTRTAPPAMPAALVALLAAVAEPPPTRGSDGRGRADPTADAASGFRDAVAEASVRLDLGEIDAARRQFREAWRRAARLREVAVPRPVRQCAFQLAQTVTLDQGTTRLMDRLEQAVSDAGTVGAPAAGSLVRARSAMEQRRADEMRREIAAGLDAIAGEAAGFPLPEWLDALRRAEAALGAGRKPEQVGAARDALRTAPGLGELRDRLSREGFDLAGQAVAEAVARFEHGANSTGCALIRATERPMVVAAAAAGDARTVAEVRRLAERMLEAERLIVRTPSFDFGWGWGGQFGEQRNRGLEILRRVRADLAVLAGGGRPDSGRGSSSSGR
jgi:hypothetical protein